MAATPVKRTAKKTKPGKPAKAGAKARGGAKGAAKKPAVPTKKATKAGAARPTVSVKKSAANARSATKSPAAVSKRSPKASAAPKPVAAKNSVTKQPIATKTVGKKNSVTKQPIATKTVGKNSVTKQPIATKTVAAAARANKAAMTSIGAKPALQSAPKRLEPKTRAQAKVHKSAGKVSEPKARAKPKKVSAQLELADWASAPPKTDSTTRARDALQLLEQRKAIKSALAPSGDGKSIVDSYMRDVDHPFKAEMEAVRQIILGASPKLSERIKWNAPSFYYKADLGAFNPRSSEFAHLILLFPDGGALPEKSPILEGSHKDRREVKFHSMDDVKSKQRALEKIIKDWVDYRDR